MISRGLARGALLVLGSWIATIVTMRMAFSQGWVTLAQMADFSTAVGLTGFWMSPRWDLGVALILAAVALLGIRSRDAQRQLMPLWRDLLGLLAGFCLLILAFVVWCCAKAGLLGVNPAYSREICIAYLALALGLTAFFALRRRRA